MTLKIKMKDQENKQLIRKAKYYGWNQSLNTDETAKQRNLNAKGHDEIR